MNSTTRDMLYKERKILLLFPVIITNITIMSNNSSGSIGSDILLFLYTHIYLSSIIMMHYCENSIAWTHRLSGALYIRYIYIQMGLNVCLARKSMNEQRLTRARAGITINMTFLLFGNPFETRIPKTRSWNENWSFLWKIFFLIWIEFFLFFTAPKPVDATQISFYGDRQPSLGRIIKQWCSKNEITRKAQTMLGADCVWFDV